MTANGMCMHVRVTESSVYKRSNEATQIHPRLAVLKRTRSLSTSTTSGTIIGNRRGEGIARSRLIVPTSNISVSSLSIQLLRPHLLVDEPEGVQKPREECQKGEQDVDQQVASTAGDEESPGGREDDSDEDEDNVRSLD